MNKYYIVPSELIESNFPDDMAILDKQLGILHTEMSLEEVKEYLKTIEPKIPY